MQRISLITNTIHHNFRKGYQEHFRMDVISHLMEVLTSLKGQGLNNHKGRFCGSSHSITIKIRISESAHLLFTRPSWPEHLWKCPKWYIKARSLEARELMFHVWTFYLLWPELYLVSLCFQSWPTETVSAVRTMLSVKYTDKNAGRFCNSVVQISPRRLKASLCSCVLSCGGSYWQWNRKQLELWDAIKNSWCWCSPQFEFVLNEHKHSVINDEGHARKEGKWVSCLRLHGELSTGLTVSVGDFVGETAPLCVNMTMKHAFTCLSETPVFSPLLAVEVL